MLHRFFIILYIVLHLPLIIIPIAVFGNTENIGGIHEYRVKCLDNDKYIVLQGSLDDSPFVFTDNEDLQLENDREHRFYCENYDEIQQHIEAYKVADTLYTRTQANKDFFAFKDAAKPVLEKNYKIEVVSTSYTPLLRATIASVIGIGSYYLTLQIVRMAYVYIRFGKVVFHPYKN